MYGFQHLTRGLDCGAYFHEFFVKQHPILCQRIQRTPIKGTGIRGHSGPEPNLYALPLTVYVSDCDGSVPHDEAAYGDDASQGSRDELVTTVFPQSELRVSPDTPLAGDNSLGIIIDDLLADMDPVDCVMMDDFCSDWASTLH
jgi:hypothetical protein